MKFNKENGQKIFLAAILLLGGLYYYFSELLGPLNAREVSMGKQIPALDEQLKQARSQLTRTHSIEVSDVNALAAKECREVMKTTIPEGSSLAWLPQRLSDWAKRQGLFKPSFRFNAESAEPGIPGYKNSFWTIELPKAEFASLGVAIAALENQEGLLQITSVQIVSPQADELAQHAQLTISTIVKQ